MLTTATLLRASEKGNGELASPLRDKVVLTHDERHLRRRALSLANGGKVFVDFPNPVVLQSGDVLMLEDGSHVEIAAADEPLYVVAGRNPTHLTELAWHIGNRHLAAAIEETRIFILRDHVIKAMLEGLGATVDETVGAFNPTRGAYAGSDHGHHHHHDDNDDHHHPR